jgi:peptidoglycan/xylan/chitin deacetylase (PgdA/CDA1 family)
MPPFRLALYGATGALLGTTVAAVLVRPPPLAWAVGALFGYLALLLGGVFVLRWRAYADAVVRGPRGARGVALTFDDGPDPRWTPVVLDLLAACGLRATFFVIGHKVDQHPTLVQAIVDGGHAVELHSYAHDRLFALRGERRVREDLERGMASLERAIGRRPRLFRPPIGHTNPTIARVADELDLTIVGWSVRGLDGYAGARPEAVESRIRNGLCDGAIVLLHDALERGGAEPPGVRALPAILDGIAAEGLEVVALDAWVEARYSGEAGSTT